MINLDKILGLPILFDEKNFDLKFEGDFAPMRKTERSLDALRPFLKNSDVTEARPNDRSVGRGPDPAYRVWRGVCLKSEEEKIKNSGLRLDLVIMPPGKICPVRSDVSNGVNCEFVKTAGHYHLSYPEMYFILYGRAYILMQSYNENPKAIKSARLTEAGAGERVFIPRDFGHNTINVFDEPLLFATLVDENVVDDYESYKNMHGASYYFLDNGNLVDIVKNPNYDSVPELKKILAEKTSAGVWRNWNTRTLQERMDESH